MRESETRLRTQEEHDPAAAPRFHQRSQAMRASMTSVGVWGKRRASPIGRDRRRGRYPFVEETNEREDDSFLGYRFCQPIHCAEESNKVS